MSNTIDLRQGPHDPNSHVFAFLSGLLIGLSVAMLITGFIWGLPLFALGLFQIPLAAQRARLQRTRLELELFSRVAAKGGQ